MTRILVVALAALTLVLPVPSAGAQDDFSARELELARAIIEVTSTEAAYRTALEATLPLARPSFASGFPGATEEQLDEAMAVMLDILMEGFPEVVEASARVYAARFTEAELTDLMAFYQTPTGRKLALEIPGITADMTRIGEQVGEQAVQNNIGRLQAVFQ